MKTKAAIEYFGSRRALAEAVGVSRESVRKWVVAGRLPQGRAYQLQIITGGRLRAESVEAGKNG